MYHPIAQEIITLLKDKNCWFETFEHEPVKTSEDAAKVRTGYKLHQGAKAMIIKYHPAGETTKKFAMLVFPADLKFDNKKVRDLLNTKDVHFANEQEISSLTNKVQIGGVPPFGNLFGLEVFVDPKLFENEKIIFNAGDRSFSVAMKSEDYKRLVKPTINCFVSL